LDIKIATEDDSASSDYYAEVATNTDDLEKRSQSTNSEDVENHV